MENQIDEIEKEIADLTLKLGETKNEEQLVQIKSSLSNAYFNLGMTYYNKGIYNDALKCHKEAYQYDDKNDQEVTFVILIAIGSDYEDMELFDEAIEHYYIATQLPDLENDDYTVINRYIGVCFDKKGDERNALKYFEKLFSLDENHDGGWYLTFRYAQLSYRVRKYSQAFKYLHRAREQIPADEIEYLLLTQQLIGYIYLVRKEFRSAKKELLKAISIKGGSNQRMAEIYCALAQSYFGLDKLNKAIQNSLIVLDITEDDDDAERAMYILAYSYRFKRKYKLEEYYINRLRKLKPSSPYLRELELSRL